MFWDTTSCRKPDPLSHSLSLSLSLVCVFAGAAAAAAPSVLEDAAARLQKARTHALTADLAVAITAQQEAEKRAAALEVESKHLKAAAAAADKAAKQSGAQAERYKKTGEDCAAKLSTRDTECVPSVYWSAPAGKGSRSQQKTALPQTDVVDSLLAPSRLCRARSLSINLAVR